MNDRGERLVVEKSTGWIYMDRNSNGNGEVSFHPSINSVLSSVSRIPS